MIKQIDWLFWVILIVVLLIFGFFGGCFIHQCNGHNTKHLQEQTRLIVLQATLSLKDDIAKLRAELKDHDEKPYLFERRK